MNTHPARVVEGRLREALRQIIGNQNHELEAIMDDDDDREAITDTLIEIMDAADALRQVIRRP